MDHVLKKNFIYLFILQNFNYIIPLLLLPYLTRTIGAENFGKISFVQAFISYFVMLTDFGINTSSAQKIIAVRKDKAVLTKVFWSTIFTKLIFALLSFLIIIILLRIIPKLESLTTLVQIASLGIFSSLLFPIWLFQGLEKMSFITVLNVFPRLLILIATVLLVKEEADYLIAIELQVGGVLLGAIASALLVWRLKIVNFYLPGIQDIKYYILDGWHIFFSGVATNIYTVTNTVVRIVH